MRYVIIGASAAGISCVEAIRQTDKTSSVTVICEETMGLYSRCMLSYYLAGTLGEEKLYFKKKDFFTANNVEAMLGVRAQKIDAKAGKVTVGNARTVDFDRLLIATGSRSKMLDIPGIDKKGVFALRTIADAQGIVGMLKDARSAVILGGGLIGLRAAYALKKRGLAVTVVVKSGQVLSQILDSRAAAMMEEKIQQQGITIKKGLEAKKILGGTKVEGVSLEDGSTLECQLVIVGKGVTPNSELARDASIEAREGIIVNDRMQTSAPAIFAAGDVAYTQDIASGKGTVNAIWPCAIEQGKIAGSNMAGKKIKYEGSLAMNSIEFFGLAVISMGITKAPSAEYEERTAVNEAATSYKKVIIKDDILRGFISVGEIENAGVYNLLIRRRVQLGGLKSNLLEKNFNYAAVMPLIKEYQDKFSDEEFRDSLITY